jgi:dephospho-CoA kinase
MTLRVGLTGGIACGKSVVEKRLLEHGVPVLDTDRVAHELLRPPTETFRRVVERFGTGVLLEDGQLDRPALGRIVFADPAAREDLNRLVHPDVGQRWRAWLREQHSPLAVVSIPLLYECGLESEFDGVLCVGAPQNVMIERLLRRGLTPEQAAQRIHAQWPVDRKMERATWTMTNAGSLEDLHTQVDTWLRQNLAQET